MNMKRLTCTRNLAMYFTCFTLAIGAASAKTFTISVPSTTSVPSGGTLTYKVSTPTVTVNCITDNPFPTQTPTQATEYAYTSFEYTDPSGVTSNFNQTTQAVFAGPSCIFVNLPVIVYTPNLLQIVFSPASASPFGVVSASPLGRLYPDYKVLSIVYAPPGNQSCDGYTNTTTDGATTSIGSTFQSGTTSGFSESLGLFGIGGTLGFTYTASTTTGNSSAFTDTLSQATSVSNCSVANPINHAQDLFVLWLNPSVTMLLDGSQLSYGVGTPTNTENQSEPVDLLEITAETMMPNAEGATTVALEALVPQIADGQVLPGLANICANLISGYPNTCTMANQCGCVPSDFAPILNQDPLLNFSSTESPLNANTSSAASCTNPKASAKCRYVPVMTALDANTQVTELLAGPGCTGCNHSVNNFIQTDSTQTAETLSETSSYSEGFSWSLGFNVLGSGLQFANSKQFTWTDSESTGAINGQANSMSVTLNSSTVDCLENIPIFEDTVYHTFVFQQPAGNTTCP